MNIINNYNINIGENNNDELLIEFYSNLKIDNFYTNPFGSNSFRFQFPDCFIYQFNVEKFIENDKIIYYYKLKILKNNIIIKNSVNQKYFWNNGWKNNLSITGFNNQLYTIEELNISLIKSILPINYADISLNLNSINIDIIKCGIVIPIFSRFEFLKLCLESLKKSKIKNCLIILVDESLTKNVNDDHIMCNELVKNFEYSDNIVIKIFKKNHGNMFDSILRGMDILYRFTNYLITIDSDTIQKENWINLLINTYEIAKDQNINNNLLLTGFNTINTGLHTISKEFDNYYFKNSFGGCNMFFERKIYLNFIRYCLNSYKWDTNIIKLLKDNNTLFLATKPSVIDHIGKISSGHRLNDKNETFDYAFDF